MAKSYKVLTDRMAGLKKGDTIPGPVHPALLGVHLKDVTEEEKTECPACQNEPVSKTKKGKKYSSADLAEHYASDHPALVAPAGEEE